MHNLQLVQDTMNVNLKFYLIFYNELHGQELLQSWPKLVGTLTKSDLLDKLHSIFSNSGQSSRSRLPPPLPNNVDLWVGKTGLNLCGANLLERLQKFFVIQHCTGGRVDQ